LKISDSNWMQIEEYLQSDDRCVVPLGSTEQHCHLSLSTDSILSERVSLEAAAPLGIPVFPVVPYGLAHHWAAFPGTITLRMETYLGVIGDIFDSLAHAGFRRILCVNGHGGNMPAANYARQWIAANPKVRIRFHNWYAAPRFAAAVREIDKVASHASWLENFAWNRLEGVGMPDGAKDLIDMASLQSLDPEEIRRIAGDGNMGGRYQRPDSEMEAVWAVGVTETRDLLTDGWP
jgi:creatinine amidohydrolase